MENVKILVVEDEDESVSILKKMLNDYKLDFCDSHKTMYAKLTECEYNLILMDIGLPGGSKNGLELIRELKADDKYKAIPVIVITALNYSGQESLAIHVGANSYITKPFVKSVLIDNISKYCR